MNRVRDYLSQTDRGHFSALTTDRLQSPFRLSQRSQRPLPPPIDYEYTEADRQADVWRSLKATMAIFAVLTTVYVVFLGSAWLFSRL
jgi:hypothetical protein